MNPSSENIPAALGGLPPAQPGKRPARSTPIGSTFADFATLPERQTSTGIYRSVFDAPAPCLERFEMHISTLNPGKTPHPPHRHPWEEILIMKEGEVRVSINGEEKRAGAGAVVFFASNDVHTVVNDGGLPATYYVINFHSEAVRSARDEPAARWAPDGLQRSCVINWEEAATKEMAHDSRRVFVASPTVTLTSLKIHATTVAAGRYPVRHSGHVNPLLVIVKEGAVESTLDTVTHLVGSGCMIFLAPGAVQTIRNPGSVPATYYVVSVTTAETPRAA